MAHTLKAIIEQEVTLSILEKKVAAAKSLMGGIIIILILGAVFILGRVTANQTQEIKPELTCKTIKLESGFKFEQWVNVQYNRGIITRLRRDDEKPQTYNVMLYNGYEQMTSCYIVVEQ